MISIFALLIVTTAASPPSKIAVTPVRGSLSSDLSVEIEESARDALLSRSKKYGLMVMRHQTMAKRMAATKPPPAPCSTVECDIELAKKLEVDLLVSMKTLHVDGEYIVMLKLLRSDSAKQLGSKTLTAQKFGEILTQVNAATKDLVDKTLQVRQSNSQNEQVLHRALVMVFRSKRLTGLPFACNLYSDHLQCKQTGITFSHRKHLHLNFADVRSIFDDIDGFGIQKKSGKTYTFRIYDYISDKRNMTAMQIEREKERRQEDLRVFQGKLEQSLQPYIKNH